MENRIGQELNLTHLMNGKEFVIEGCTYRDVSIVLYFKVNE